MRKRAGRSIRRRCSPSACSRSPGCAGPKSPATCRRFAAPRQRACGGLTWISKAGSSWKLHGRDCSACRARFPWREAVVSWEERGQEHQENAAGYGSKRLRKDRRDNAGKGQVPAGCKTGASSVADRAGGSARPCRSRAACGCQAGRRQARELRLPRREAGGAVCRHRPREPCFGAAVIRSPSGSHAR